MANEVGKNKKKKEIKRNRRIMSLIGKKLCACCGGHKRECSGPCMEKHIDKVTREIKCGELYTIDRSMVKRRDSNRDNDNIKHSRKNIENRNRKDREYRKEKRWVD